MQKLHVVQQGSKSSSILPRASVLQVDSCMDDSLLLTDVAVYVPWTRRWYDEKKLFSQMKFLHLKATSYNESHKATC